MLKKFKQATLKSLKAVHVSSLVEKSRWRRQRLMILAYHGISVADEHLWSGSQYMPADVFRTRLQSIEKSGCTVLPLAEAIKRLYENDLPDKSVAITFDDGTHDFYQCAWPILKEFGFPVTLYLTTFYSNYNKPVFDLMCAYLLWKGRSKTLDLKKLIGLDLKTELHIDSAREAALAEIHAFAKARELSAEEKDALVASLAAELKVDYQTLIDQRIMHNITPDEVRQLTADGVDIQLHTHRHRTPKDRQLFLREIADNRRSLQEMTGKWAAHFCYPSGRYDYAFLPWLREAGIVSATTCEPGFASRASDPLLLPRILDSCTLSPIEFESWLTGISAALPRRANLKTRYA
jgi:peptidoglycan/xylan/chitin deacetylase (PgdA/CDA1 family)